MSSDGAHQGINAERALKTIIGGEPEPGPEEHRSPDEMRQWLLFAPSPPFDYDDDGYGQCARYAGKLILEVFLADPAMANFPVETDYDWQGDPSHGVEGMKPEYVRTVGLSDAIAVHHPDVKDKISDLRLSGFQWGWAVNAARYCVALPPEPNPAIYEV